MSELLNCEIVLNIIRKKSSESKVGELVANVGLGDEVKSERESARGLTLEAGWIRKGTI